MRPELAAFIEMRLEDGPINGVDIALECAKVHMDDVSNKDIVDSLEELVRLGRIVEVEYTLPKMDYRVKSIYFPAGTKVSLRHGTRE